jgi:hypothetical protein
MMRNLGSSISAGGWFWTVVALLLVLLVNVLAVILPMKKGLKSLLDREI